MEPGLRMCMGLQKCRSRFLKRLHKSDLENIMEFAILKRVPIPVCLCLTSHRQRGHSETAPPFTVPCEGREAR